MKIPFVTKTQLEEISKIYPTPFYIYDEAGIRANARRVHQAFALKLNCERDFFSTRFN